MGAKCVIRVPFIFIISQKLKKAEKTLYRRKYGAMALLANRFYLPSSFLPLGQGLSEAMGLGLYPFKGGRCDFEF